MNYLRECDTLTLSLPSLVFTAFGAGCRVIEFSEKPLWREIGWIGARVFPPIAMLAGTALVIHRFVLALIMRITNNLTGRKLTKVVNVADFMEKRLTFVTTAISLIPIVVLYGPWIFKSSESFSHFIEKAKAFYIETASRFDSLPT